MERGSVNTLMKLLKYKACPVAVYIDLLNGKRKRIKYKSLNDLIEHRNHDELLNAVLDEAVVQKSLLSDEMFILINLHEE